MNDNERDPNEPVTATYGHGSIHLTAYPSSSRIGIEASADNSVMDWSELFEFVDRIRKPRTITTVEELNALPVGAVLILRDAKHEPHPAQKGEYGWRVPFVDRYFTSDEILSGCESIEASL